MAKKKDYDWRKDWDWTDPEDGPASWDDVEVKEIEIDLDKFLLPKEYAYGGGVGHLLEPTQTYHQYHDFTAPMSVGAMVDNMYNRGGRVNYESGGWNPGVGRDKKGYQKTSPHHSSRDDGPPSITNPYVPPVVKKSPPVQTSDNDNRGFLSDVRLQNQQKYLDLLKTMKPDDFRMSSILDGTTSLSDDELDFLQRYGAGNVLNDLAKQSYENFMDIYPKGVPPKVDPSQITSPRQYDFAEVITDYPSNNLFAEVTPKQKDVIGKDINKLNQGLIDTKTAYDNAKIFDNKGSTGFWGMGKEDPNPMTPAEFNQELIDQGYKGTDFIPEETMTGKDGGRVGMFMGGDPLTGQALAIYESMNSYGFSDAEIASALQQQGLYTPPGSSTPTPDPTPTPTPGQGGVGESSDPYSTQIVDQTDYSFNKKNYRPGGKLEVNPAALGMSFYEQPTVSKKVTKELGQFTPEELKGVKMSEIGNLKLTDKFSVPKQKNFFDQILSEPAKVTSQFTTPTGIQPRGPAELGFMTKEIEGLPGLTRDQIRAMYDNYNPWMGRKSNYANARVPGKGGQIIGGILGALGGIPGLGFLAGRGSGKDKSMQSKYGVEGGFGGGNTKFRDEFGLSVVDDSKRLFGKRDRNYLDRMEEQMGKNIDFFGGTRTSLFGGKKLDKKGSSVENFAERWANFDDLDAADQQALINEMKAINSFKAKQMLAYKNRIATEKINKDWQQKQEDIATQERIDAEKDFVTQDLGVTAADAATSGRGMDHTRGMTSRERGAAAARMGGGSRQAKSGSQKAGGSGRTDKGWGWAHGGPVGVASMFTRRR